MPGSCPARSARGGGSGLRPAEIERLEDEAAAAGRRMGANQLVVLNVYDMVSAAPGGPCEPADRPVGTGWDPGPWLPAWRPRLQLSSPGVGGGDRRAVS